MTTTANSSLPSPPAAVRRERAACLEWVEGESAESGYTAEGRRTHVRVDESMAAFLPPTNSARRWPEPQFL